MSLCVIAYPEIAAADHASIQQFRSRNDAYFHLVEPHFSLIFPIDGWETGPFIAEVQRQATDVTAFSFCIRGAALNKDISGKEYHAFLVPDEGHSQLLKLRYRLMAGRFSCPEAYEYDFVPHIGVGNSRDPARCAAMVEHWNAQDFVIQGWVRALDVASYENSTVSTVQRVCLVA